MKTENRRRCYKGYSIFSGFVERSYLLVPKKPEKLASPNASPFWGTVNVYLKLFPSIEINQINLRSDATCTRDYATVSCGFIIYDGV